MSTDDISKIVWQVVLSFGGATIVVVGLASWLGSLWASRILQREKTALDSSLESIRHELGIAKSAYEHHLDLILQYYATFYQHYRLCQRTASADAHRQLPDGAIVYTKDEFVAALGSFLDDWAAQEGRIRLLLPAKLLKLHEEAIVQFNAFKRAVDQFTPAEPMPRKKELVFHQIEDIKCKLEDGLREFLRTESLLK